MVERSFKVYKYRFVVLVALMLVNAVVQLLWIVFSPIMEEAGKFYNNVGKDDIGLLLMVWMVVYLIVSIPASWIIDKFGARVGVSIGAVLVAVFSILRGYIGGTDYGTALLFSALISIGQPFVMNATTTVAAKWFAITSRAIAGGLVILSTFIGIIAGFILTPGLFSAYGMEQLLVIYGWIAVVCAVIFIVLSREAPATPPCPPGHEERALVMDGFKNVWKIGQFNLVMVVMFIGFGMFNAITTYMEPIAEAVGVDNAEQVGFLGFIMILGGVFGTVIWPTVSDKLRKRGRVIMWAILLGAPGLIGLTFLTNFTLLCVAGFTLGFFTMSVGPIVWQFGAEVTRPTPEGTSNGLLVMVGQLSGIIFILLMSPFVEKGSMIGTFAAMTVVMLVFLAFKLVNVFLASRLRDSSLINEEAGD